MNLTQMLRMTITKMLKDKYITLASEIMCLKASQGKYKPPQFNQNVLQIVRHHRSHATTSKINQLKKLRLGIYNLKQKMLGLMCTDRAEAIKSRYLRILSPCLVGYSTDLQINKKYITRLKKRRRNGTHNHKLIT